MGDFYDYVERKANKDHKCDLCRKPIEKGNGYINGSGRYDGGFFRVRHHKRCDELVQEFLRETREQEYSHDEVRDWLYEKYCHNCGHCREGDCMLEAEPFDCDRFIKG